MLKRLVVKNFQSHKDTKLEFSSGLNVIQGQSQAGKTAIIRAFELLRTYRPLGYRFHNSSSKGPVKVEIETGEGKTIVLEKNKTVGKYIVPGDDFSHVGTTVPPKVTALLNMSDINIQKQLDPYFLLTDSPGQVAKVFNELMGLSVLDPAVSELTSRINSTNREIEEKKNSLLEKTEQLKRLGYLDEVEEIVNQLTELDETEDEILKQESDLQSYLKDLEEVDFSIGRLKKWLRIGEELPELEELLRKQKELTQEYKELESTKKVLDELEKKRESLVDMEGSKQVVDTCLHLLKRKDNLQKEVNLLTEIRKVQGSIDGVEERLKTLKQEYFQKIREQKTCPLCGSTLTNEGIEKVLSGM